MKLRGVLGLGSEGGTDVLAGRGGFPLPPSMRTVSSTSAAPAAGAELHFTENVI